MSRGDETSSCWVRVSSAWAGQSFGGVQIPRAGDEVVVDFINGDPDRPIITGRVYNEASMPPWTRQHYTQYRDIIVLVPESGAP